MSDGGGRDAEPLKVIEPGYSRLIAPNPGIIEDRRGDAELARQVSGIDAAVRTVYDHSSRGLSADAGDAVSG